MAVPDRERGARSAVLPACAVMAALVTACSGGHGAAPSGGHGPSHSGGPASSAPASAPARAALMISGAGEAGAAAVFQQWASQYAAVNRRVAISYRPSGLGTALSEIGRGGVDFGGTDAIVPSAQLAPAAAAGRGPVLQLPVALGAVAVVFNVPGVTRLVLSGPVLAQIYLGLIIKWNDPAIARLNPGRRLPGTTIQVFQRSDQSGGNEVFSQYLTATSSSWAGQVGSGMAPQWPIGTSVTGSSGIAAAVGHTSGAIGYLELGYARSARLPYAALTGAGGIPVAPSAATLSAAAGAWHSVTGPSGVSFSLARLSAPGAYPLATPAYLVLARRAPAAGVAGSLRAWLDWALTAGPQAALTRVGFAPLPLRFAAEVRAQVRTLR